MWPRGNADDLKNYCIQFRHLIANNRSLFEQSTEAGPADMLPTGKSECNQQFIALRGNWHGGCMALCSAWSAA
jgi:hypothetical protein